METEAKSYFDLSQLFVSSILGGVVSTFAGVRKTDLPREINGYKLVDTYKDENGIENPCVGIYKDSVEKKAIGKMWSGNIKDFEYFNLKNEIIVFNILTAVSARVEDQIPTHLQNVSLPKILKVEQEDDFLFILTEFVGGAPVSEISEKDQLEVCLKVQEYINFLGKHLTSKERNKITKRPMSSYLIIYPFILFKAIFNHPGLILKLLKGVAIFLKSLPLVSQSRLRLVHKDLHFKNILKSGERIIILDLQFSVLTVEVYELVTILHYNWAYKGFKRLLIDQLRERFRDNLEFNRLFFGLCVNSATHGLTDNRFSREKIESYADFLNFAISRGSIN